MSLKDDLLPLIDDLRSIPGELGFRPYEVYVRIETWTGPVVGMGTSTIVDTQLLVGGQNPKVRQVQSKDTVTGTTEFVNAVWEIGPITPAFPGGGYPNNTFDPRNVGGATAANYYLLKGPGLPATGLLCQPLKEDVDRPLRGVIRVRSTGRRSPT